MWRQGVALVQAERRQQVPKPVEHAAAAALHSGMFSQPDLMPARACRK
jgi:hypothetical protein